MPHPALKVRFCPKGRSNTMLRKSALHQMSIFSSFQKSSENLQNHSKMLQNMFLECPGARGTTFEKFMKKSKNGAKHSSVASSLSGPSGEIGPSTLDWALGPLTQHSSRSRPYQFIAPGIVSRIITKNLLIPSKLNFKVFLVSAGRSERPKMTPKMMKIVIL